MWCWLVLYVAAEYVPIENILLLMFRTLLLLVLWPIL